MRPLQGYWLEPVSEEPAATSGLGLQFVGRSASKGGGLAEACPQCSNPLRLLAVCPRSPFIPLERYEALLLLLCRACAEESDGFEDGNGFLAKFVDAAGLERALRAMRRHLRQPVFFRAEPTGEPEGLAAFETWKAGRVRGKLGGRQIAIQAARPPRPCPACGAAWTFVASFEEAWAGESLNFGAGLGYLWACSAECREDAAAFYWDCR